MKAVRRCALAVVLCSIVAPVVRAQQGPPPAKDPQAAAAKPAQKPEAKPEPQPDQAKPDQAKPDQPKYEETVVVSASKNEEKLINAPATVTVIGPETIESAPTQNFAELLRTVPGVNITQVSARDINVTSRGATGTLATGMLALLDGRSLYQDFFGFVMWDFLPVNLNEIKQVEVIRGPASAVWGANAVAGVVNVITTSPREMQGTSAVLGVGGFDRQSDTTGASSGSGTLYYISGTHAQAVNDRVAYKISAGGYTQDPYGRPTGTIPCDRPEVCLVPRKDYPAFTNRGPTQPKFDARADSALPDAPELASIAPKAQTRPGGGGYIQAEIFLAKRSRLVAGARLDRFDYLDTAVFSPRVAFLVKPQDSHTIRLTYNRAYRSPSVINNFLDITIAEPLNLGVFDRRLNGRTFPIPIHPARDTPVT